MSNQAPDRVELIRRLISDFLSERLRLKTEKLALDDPSLAELRAQFEATTWLADAARRAGQIQAVTHSLKPIHPDAKGSSLFCEPSALPSRQELSSQVLGSQFDTDVVGNAAALDVYKLLKLEHDGQSLLSLCVAQDPDLCAALHSDESIATAWMQAFAGLAQPRGTFSSHTQAKQVYWPLGAPSDDASYHLLAPLFPTSLVHRVYHQLQDDRFSDEAKAAREARKSGAFHERPVREYRNLAIQKLGGTKPQNISQLNSERRGENALFASLPPMWQSLGVKPPMGVDSMFEPFRWRGDVRALVKQLRTFLEGGPARNRATRDYIDELLGALLDELMQYIAEVQALPPGWSADAQCLLPEHQKALLDDGAGLLTADEPLDSLATDFAHWLNAQLRDPLPLGDDEYLHWRRQARELFNQAQREGTYEW